MRPEPHEPDAIAVRRVPRSRHLTLRVREDGAVTVGAPHWVSLRTIREFVAAQAVWVAQERVRLAAAPPALTRTDYLRYREAARRLVALRLEEVNRHYDFSFKRVAIRDTRTRWGSCSRDGNLNFSYRLVLLTPELCDYVIAHELCHLAEFNHGPRFWALVARACPDYARLRRELRGLRL